MVSKLAGKFVPLALLFLFVILPACTNQSSNSEPTTIIEKVEVPVTRIVTREVEKVTIVEVTRIVEVFENSATVTETNEPVPNQDYTGTYLISWTDEASCELLIVHELKPSELFDELAFELLCNRGSPSYNMGYATDAIMIFENTAVWTSDFGNCSIILKFQENGVAVIQIGKDFDCGFGGGVLATGMYELQDARVPNLGCLNPIAPCN